MKFEKTYKQYMEQFVVEGLLGSIAAAIPKTIGKAVGNVVKQAYADNPYVQAFGQVRQDQQGQREAQRSKEGEILKKLEEELMNDPHFISKQITFVFSMSGVSTTEHKKYSDLRKYNTRKEIDAINAISKVVAQVDLNDPSFNLYNSTVQKNLSEKVNEVLTKENKEKKEDMGEDYKKVKAEIPNIMRTLERMLKNILQPLGGTGSKSVDQKEIWLFILANMSGTTPTIKV
jgi:hypothetical protein